MSKRPQPVPALMQRARGLASLTAAVRRNEATAAKVAHHLPADLAPHCRAVVDHGRQLVIYVDSPAWATRFRFMAPALSRALGPRGSEPRITIRILPESRTEQVPMPAAVRSTRGASTVQAVAESMQDTPLARALARLAGAIGRRR